MTGSASVLKIICLTLYLTLCLTSLGISLKTYANTPGAQAVSDPALEQATTNIYNVLNNNLSPAVNSMNGASRTQTKILQDSLTGSTRIGATMNTYAQQQDFRHWVPTSKDLADMVQQGLQTGSLSDQIQYYNKKFPLPKAAHASNMHTENMATHYAIFSAINTNAALSVADKGFDNTQKIINEINYLYALIDQQQTLKQSVDLNSALLVRITYLQAELMRMQALQVKMQAVGQQQTNTQHAIMSKFTKDLS